MIVLVKNTAQGMQCDKCKCLYRVTNGSWAV